MPLARLHDDARPLRSRSWPLWAVSYATLTSLLVSGCDYSRAGQPSRAPERGVALDLAGPAPARAEPQFPDASPAPRPAPARAELTAPAAPGRADAAHAEPSGADRAAPIAADSGPPLAPGPAQTPNSRALALAPPDLPAVSPEMAEEEDNAGPSPLTRLPLEIAAVDTAEPIAPPALVRIDARPVVLPAASPARPTVRFARLKEAAAAQAARAAVEPLRPPAPQRPTRGNAPAPERPLNFVASAGAAVDQRAYVPQISESGRQAYIAQLDLANPRHRLAVRIDGEIVGALQFQVSQGRVEVHVGQVLDLFESRMDPARFAALRSSQAARAFVSLDKIRDAGIPLEYDPAYDELVLSRSSG